MVLNALLMELAFTKLPETLTEFGIFTIIALMKILIVSIFYTNIKNKIN
jgi:hypothetical protein